MACGPSSASACRGIDTSRYPIHDAGSPGYRDLVLDARERLKRDGCCQLSDFVLPEAIAALKAECSAMEATVAGNQAGRKVNCFYTLPAPDLSPHHPVNVEFARRFGVIRDDMIPSDSVLRGIYENDDLKSFIADVLGVPALYRSRDAYQALTINVMMEGESLHWHFDCNSCAITLGIQEPVLGGELEFVPNIGRANFKDIEATIHGAEDRPATREYHTREGQLIFFLGGESIHRVKEVRGNRTRLVAALQYHLRDDAFDPADMTERIYGVPAAEHRGPKPRLWAASCRPRQAGA